jgi:hypothetical protein
MRYSRNARRPNKKYPKGPTKYYVVLKPCKNHMLIYSVMVTVERILNLLMQLNYRDYNIMKMKLDIIV